MTTPQLVVASNNAHKVEEIRAILTPYLTPEQLGGIVPLSYFTTEEPLEDGVTFLDNSLIKARAASRISGLPALADDSGITVDVLGGAPGVFSARWCGTHGDDAANRNLLLAQLRDVPRPHRGCAFVTVMTLVSPTGEEWSAKGRVGGTLTTVPRGDNGFGYDPIFVPDGYEETTAQMSADQKNELSHRASALRQLAPAVVNALGG